MTKIIAITLTYNSKNFIKPCLEALFSSKGDFELSTIIVDNNSSDGTLQYIQDSIKTFAVEPSKIQFIQSGENNGFAAGINIGIRAAMKENFDFIFLINPDTKVQPDTIQRLLSNFFSYNASDTKKTLSTVKFQNVGIVGAQMASSDKTPQATFGNFPSFTTEFLQKTRLYKIFPFGRYIPYNRFSKKYFQNICKVDWVSGGAMMIKKEVIEKIGLFDENYFMYIEDIDFCKRAKNAGFEILYDPNAKIWHKLMASSLVNLKPQTQKLNILNTIVNFFKKTKVKIWQKESLAYYFKKWQSGLPEIVCRYTKYHLEPAGYRKLKFIIQQINKMTKQQTNNMSILDIGCGNGNISFPLAALGFKVIALDINSDIICALKLKTKTLGLNNIDFIETDVNDLSKIKNEKFDIIIMSEILEHLNDPQKTLQDAKLLLNQNGIIIVTIPNKFSLEEIIRKFFSQNKFLNKIKNKIKEKFNTDTIQSSHNTPHLHFFSYSAFKKIARKANLQIIKQASQSAGFKSFYYIYGRFFLNRKSSLFHISDQIDNFIASSVQVPYGDGMMFILKIADS